jgi:integrase
VKTVNGYRQIPVHRDLLKIGFVGLVEEARKHPDKLLFPDVPTGSDSYRSSVFSKRYATFLRSLKLEEGERRVTFHSFRHTFRDQLRRPEANTDLVRELGGWSRGSETSTAYGDGTPAHVLRTLVDGIDYGIDLTHLYSSA